MEFPCWRCSTGFTHPEGIPYLAEMKRYSFLFTLLFLLSHVSFSQNWDWGGPIDPLQKKFKVLHYKLELELLPETKSIAGSNTVTFEAKEKLDTIRLQLISAYEVSNVTMNGEKVAFSHHDDLLDIIPIDCTCNSVKVEYSGKTPIAQNPPWTGGFTWIKDELDNDWMGLSSQGEGAKIFMPALDHPSSEPSEGVDLFFTVQKPYFVAANGRLLEKKEEGENVTYHWATSYPINNYNVNFTLGVFHEESKIFTSSSGNQVPMTVYVLEENKAKAASLLAVLEESAQTHEKYFGPYPWPDDKVAVVETPYLGMEHQTINAYGNNFQYIPLGATQYDWLLHHELGHEWFGNKVSVGDWADMWIHEGLTAYGDILFFLEHGGEEEYLKKAKSVLRGIPHEKPVQSPPNSTEEEAYHGEIYSKGSFIIHSLRGVLGDEIFFPMLKAFATDERFTYQNQVTTKDFTDFVQNYSGKDLNGFFELYLRTTGLPIVEVKKKGKKGWQVELTGINFELPVEVQTSNGIQKVVLGKKAVLVQSATDPIVDPNYWLMLQRED